MSVKVLIMTLFTLMCCSLSSAQMYDTSENRRQKAEALKQAEEQAHQNLKMDLKELSFQEKEGTAKEFVGKRFWYVPKPIAANRIRFYETIPPSSYSEDSNLLFTPLSTTSFVVTGVVMAPPLVYPVGKDEYLLEIGFPDGKVGYVNVVGPFGLSRNLYKGGEWKNNIEYIYIESPEEIIATQNAKRELAKRVARELVEAEKAARELAERVAREKAAKLQEEQKRKEAARQKAILVQETKPEPLIGMTRNQVMHESRWGMPQEVNKTTTVHGTSEQWVYGTRRYLYFENGVLTAIQH